MAKSAPQKLVKLDGRTGEGGGQLGKRNGGLKAQHVSAIKWLAKITSAETTGCFVGSKTIEFKPNSLRNYTIDRDIKIDADSASSILLVLQAILPAVLFANDAAALPIKLLTKGGTNGSFSLSYEYLDQVLLKLAREVDPEGQRTIGVLSKVDLMDDGTTNSRKVRGWSHGPLKLGHAEFKIHPIPFGQSLKAPNWPTERGSVKEIDISILVLETLHELLETALATTIKQRFPEVKINIVLREYASDIYTFSSSYLCRIKIWARLTGKVVEDLDSEFKSGGLVDEYLRDQLVIFQALADGRSTILGHKLSSDPKSRPDRTDEPFGDGSNHTTTARWVASQMLPLLKWYDNGQTCEGVVPVTLLSFINHKYDSATSSGNATCFVNTLPSISLNIFSFTSSPIPFHNSVFTGPGLTTLTLTGAKSTAKPLAIPCNPAAKLVTILHPFIGLSAVAPVVNVIEACGPSLRYLLPTFATINCPKNLTCPAFCISSSDAFSNGARANASPAVKTM
ncbi:hypothetical protein BTUL_0014g00050 [Botrytis tulipae]|uniref:RNA 3'-terminal phosphate cyclase domain-containing protein n=1 Tax=Botrytis tulipae TaxID=87230 RepID=A0A4Z1F4G2_9HELO|nr:hypothetical protein BTUL_0014g00050 [Botrytis tulipae]